MNIRGDRRADYPEGTRLGPGADGLMREVTGTTYDETTGMTKVSFRMLEVDDHTLRFQGEQ